jgi:ubiquinone/menaquinone biosynthesis C-methylase UbiE
MLTMLDQLLENSRGKLIFTGKGLDGEITQFLINGAISESNPIIRWICDKAPTFLATRERFGIFRAEAQKRLANSMHLASVPCGVMDDLLTLHLSDLQRISFSGIDLDEKSLTLAAANANSKGRSNICNFSQSNAWDLCTFDGSFDILTSNGLNIYEPDDTKVTALYTQFFNVLKPGGILIASFLTPLHRLVEIPGETLMRPMRRNNAFYLAQ